MEFTKFSKQNKITVHPLAYTNTNTYTNTLLAQTHQQ